MIIRKSEFAEIVGRSRGAITQLTQGRDGNSPTIPVFDGKFIDTNNQIVRGYMMDCGVCLNDEEIENQFGFFDRSTTVSGRNKEIEKKSSQKTVKKSTELSDREKREDRMALAKLKKAEADAMKADIQSRELRGKLVSRELFIDIAMSYLAELHSRLLNEMPISIATVVSGIEKDENFVNKVEREIHDTASSILKSSAAKIEKILSTHPQNEDFIDDSGE